jgi:predicted dehydrogenase
MTSANSDQLPLRVLMVGCGNIAGGFDERRPSDALPLTHAGAYRRDRRFTLAACIEPDERRRREFMAAWSVPVGVRSIAELPSDEESFDVISICSPTECHAHDLAAALRLQPRLIFCEKPVTNSLAETERCVAACAVADVPLAVNYTRRWDPDIARLRAELNTGAWGTLRTVHGLYNKGILNNGSHMLDLLHVLLGPLNIIEVGRAVHDYVAGDPSVPVWLESSQGVPVHLACAHAEDYAVFELQLVFSSGVLTMEEGGMYWRERRVVDSDSFAGYRKLGEGSRRPGDYPQAMLKAVDNIYRAITAGATLASTGASACDAQRLCEEITQRARSIDQSRPGTSL